MSKTTNNTLQDPNKPQLILVSNFEVCMMNVMNNCLWHVLWIDLFHLGRPNIHITIIRLDSVSVCVCLCLFFLFLILYLLAHGIWEIADIFSWGPSFGLRSVTHVPIQPYSWREKWEIFIIIIINSNNNNNNNYLQICPGRRSTLRSRYADKLADFPRPQSFVDRVRTLNTEQEFEIFWNPVHAHNVSKCCKL